LICGGILENDLKVEQIKMKKNLVSIKTGCRQYYTPHTVNIIIHVPFETYFIKKERDIELHIAILAIIYRLQVIYQ
jgi:hypothetical protein